MNKINVSLLLIVPLMGSLLISLPTQSGGLDCSTMPEWSTPTAASTKNKTSLRVNLHHVFCGEAGRNGKAKGFHSTPGGLEDHAPNTYVRSTLAERPNASGIYTLRRIKLHLHGSEYTKSFSTMFPDHCTQQQVEKSIVYSSVKNKGKCRNPGWALCGPSAPASHSDAYCKGTNGKAFTVASAPPRNGKINTGFPIYK